MEPFARLGKRPKLHVGNGLPQESVHSGRRKRQATPKDRMMMFQIIQAISNFGKSLNRIPFYRHRGQR